MDGPRLKGSASSPRLRPLRPPRSFPPCKRTRRTRRTRSRAEGRGEGVFESARGPSWVWGRGPCDRGHPTRPPPAPATQRSTPANGHCVGTECLPAPQSKRSAPTDRFSSPVSLGFSPVVRHSTGTNGASTPTKRHSVPPNGHSVGTEWLLCAECEGCAGARPGIVAARGNLAGHCEVGRGSDRCDGCVRVHGLCLSGVRIARRSGRGGHGC